MYTQFDLAFINWLMTCLSLKKNRFTSKRFFKSVFIKVCKSCQRFCKERAWSQYIMLKNTFHQTLGFRKDAGLQNLMRERVPYLTVYFA